MADVQVNKPSDALPTAVGEMRFRAGEHPPGELGLRDEPSGRAG